MNRTKKFFFNTITTAGLQIFTMLSGFILPRVMLSVYGSEINGLVSSITQFISYLTLVEAGLSGSIVYSLYKPLAENDMSAINAIASAAKKFYFKAGYLFLGLITGGALVYPLFVKTELLSFIEVGILFLVLGANGILEFFTLAKYRALLTADQRTYVISLAGIAQVVLNCLTITILSYQGVSVVIVRLIAIFSILLRTVILWAYCKKKYKYLDFSAQPNDAALSKRWDALYFQIIGVVHTGAPVLIITAILSLTDVSVYSIYHVVIGGISSILGIFTSGLSAGFGDLYTRDEKSALKNAFQQFEYVYYILITIVYSIMMATYIPFIKIYTAGADINYIYPSFAILVTVNGYLYSLKTPYGMLTIAEGKYCESRVQITIQASIQIVASVIGGLVWGLNGVIIGALLSNIYRNVDFIFFAPKHLIDYKFTDTLVMWIRSGVLFAVLSTVLMFIPSKCVTNYFSWFIYAVALGFVAVICVVFVNFIFDYNRMKECIIRIKTTISRR